MNKRIIRLEDAVAAFDNDPHGYIDECESEYKSAIKRISDRVLYSDTRRDVLLISGPSSSGKSTTAEHIRRNITDGGMDCVTLSTDDFFFDKDEMNAYVAGFDFESPTIVNELLLLDKVNELLLRGEAYLPRFDFVSGRKVYKSHKEQLAPNGVIIIEGIHALNKNVIEVGKEIDTVRVYVSTASSIAFDGEIISGRNLRLARRIVRDSKFRGTPLEGTVDMWESVCNGEDAHIAPHMESADYVIDTLLPYEPFMFRRKMLKLIDASFRKYAHDPQIEALTRLYEKCPDADTALIPPDSLLREFVGGGIYG
ncbi:MAG: hypothetical protein Q3982_09470 [Phoenicibacter congonensis]|uniref:AAA+ ATPase domain-containing protein n=1 Tax=Phoenicibacter congonensis TaxID=1944646 RepID=A0AA43UAR9_9ACTN|nr:hypothetical protein [Phoenicibacter congonensis]